MQAITNDVSSTIAFVPADGGRLASEVSVELSKIASPSRVNMPPHLRIIDQLGLVRARLPANQSVTEKDVRALLRHRRNRDRYFPGALFADPAWDILLELYAAELGQQKIAISCLGVKAGVPMTTALRWINILEKSGLIERRQDPLDGRRYFVSLSCQGLEAMTAYFETVPAGVSLI